MAATSWHYANRTGQQQGPVSAETLRELFMRGEVTRESLVWRDGMVRWLPLAQVGGEVGIPAGSAMPPPMPGMYPPSQRRAGSPKPVGKGNGCLIIGAVAAVAMVPIIGVLAAIAIPQYQVYVSRAQFMEAMSIVENLKPRVSEQYLQNGACPGNTDPFEAPETYGGKYVGSVKFGTDGDTGACLINMRFRNVEPVVVALRGQSVTFSGTAKDGALTWTCRSELSAKFLPPSCR